MLRALGVLSGLVATAHAAGQHYKPHDPVFVVANKVGPFNNPSETYEVTELTTPLNGDAFTGARQFTNVLTVAMRLFQQGAR
jgi:hypothetical protein